MNWYSKTELRQAAERAAMSKESLTLTGVEVLQLLDAVDAAEDALDIAESEVNDLQLELKNAYTDLDTAVDENIELRSGAIRFGNEKAQA